jgi:hypothetical protein
MATSKKVTELTAITTAANGDLLYVVHDPAGVPASNKITVQDMFKRVVSIGAAPANNASSGTQGQMIANGSFLYVCVSSNTWIRVAATTSW